VKKKIGAGVGESRRLDLEQDKEGIASPKEGATRKKKRALLLEIFGSCGKKSRGFS